MTKKIFKLISVLVLCSVALLAFDYDAEYLEINHTYKLNEDGSITETYHNKVKLHTYQATQRLFGEDFIIYNPDHQKLTIKKSVTKMVDGTLVPTPANGYNEVLPRGATGDENYAVFREMVVTHTGLERGCVIDFEYSLNSEAGYYPGLMGEVVFAKNNPVKSYRVNVIVPQEMALKFALINGEIEPDKTTDHGYTRYTWKMTDIDPVLTESNSIALEENQPKLVFSTFKNWEDLYGHFSQTVDQPGDFTVEMKQKMNELTMGLANPFEKIQKIHNFVVDHTGFAKLSPAITGYQIKNVVDTYNQNSGTSLDKSLLLSAMLQQAGFDAYISFVSKATAFSDEVPSLAQFDNVVVTTRWTNGETHILSPTHSQTNSLDAELNGKYLFRLDEKLKKIQPAKSFSETVNFQKMTLNLELCKELKFSGKGTFNLGGKYHSYYTLKDPGKANIVIGGSLANLKAAEEKVTMLDMKEATIVADLSAEALELKNDYIYWDLPEFNHGFNNSDIATAVTKRKTTLDLYQPVTETYCLTIRLPENVTLASPEFKEYKKCDMGNVSVKLEKDANTITIERSLVIKSDRVTPENYSDFHEMIKVWEKPNYRQLIFKVSE